MLEKIAVLANLGHLTRDILIRPRKRFIWLTEACLP